MGGLPTTGGATLATTYPGYLSYTHALMLVGATALDTTTLEATDIGTDPYNAVAFLRQQVDENPYFLAEAYSPEDALGISNAAIEAFEELVATYLTSTPNTGGEIATVEDFIAKAAELFNTYNVDTSGDIANELDIFEQSTLDSYARRRNDFEGAMFDVNAIESTAYIMGLALIAGERTRSLDDLRTKLTIAARANKSTFLLQLTELLAQLQTRNAGLYQATVGMRDAYARWNYTAYREQQMQDVEYDVGEVSWELEALANASSIMGAIQGIPMSPKKPSNLQTAVSTALSVGPQVGMAIGNATGNPMAGLLAGGLAALFSYGSNING